MKLHAAIALGLIAGLLLGLVAAVTGSPLLVGLAEGVAPIGTAFVNLLRMVVVPLVATTVFVGVAGLGDLKKLGRLGFLTVLFFVATTLVSVVIGMGAMRLLLPLASEAAAEAAAGAVTGGAEAPELPGTIEFLVSLIPSNPFEAAAEGALLPLIVFTCLFAAAVGGLPAEHRDRLMDIASSLTTALIRLVHWVLWVAPVGVFALAAPVTAQSGWSMLQSLAVFVIAVVLGLIVFVAGVYMPLAVTLGRQRPGPFLRALIGPQLIAFTTTSQAATIPAMLEAAAELRVSRTAAGFVISLGAAIGRAGSALFQGAALIFLAWLYQIPIPIAGLGAAVLATGLVSFTVASVPSASVVTLAPALGAVGVPLDGLAVLLGVDRIPDMFRTAVNATGTMTAAVVVDRRSDVQAARRLGESPERLNV
jgi:Na+/H+-dicarboxylate symporter